MYTCIHIYVKLLFTNLFTENCDLLHVFDYVQDNDTDIGTTKIGVLNFWVKCF